jgi:hypothetical protein
LLRCPLARNGSPDTMEQQMLKSPNSSQTSDRDRELKPLSDRPLSDNELELVSGGARQPYGDAIYDILWSRGGGSNYSS